MCGSCLQSFRKKRSENRGRNKCEKRKWEPREEHMAKAEVPAAEGTYGKNRSENHGRNVAGKRKRL